MTRIERIEITSHRLALDPPFPAAWDRRPRRAFPVTVVRVHDDEGRVGFGAGDPMRGLADHLSLFVGEDPSDLERHGAILANIAFHDGRPWPLDTALWDLAAKTDGLPVWGLLGGDGRSLRPYASWGLHRSPDDSVAAAVGVVAEGFDAIKLRFGRSEGIDADIEVLGAVRAAVGPGVDLMVDCNQGWRMPWDVDEPWDAPRALAVAERLAGHGVAWVEEPLHRGDHGGMAWLRERSPVPIAGGEMTREPHELALMLERGCLDIYQPDVVVTGGFAALSGFAHDARREGCSFAPHTWGSGVALVANAHLAAAVAEEPLIEFPYDPPEWTPARRDFILTRPVVPVDGRIELGSDPGLGVELDRDRLEATLTDSVGYA